jgi:hypothetical protein
VIAAIETFALAVSLYYLYKFGRIILKIEDSLEESLDLLDERYRSISKILEIPLFYDSPEIKKVVEDVSACREVILKVANSIAKVEEYNEGKEKKSVN